jgi:hypothetical protein
MALTREATSSLVECHARLVAALVSPVLAPVLALALALGVLTPSALAQTGSAPQAQAGPKSQARPVPPPPPMPRIRFSRGGAGCDDPEVAYHPRCYRWRQAYRKWQQSYGARGSQ